ncbi:MAG: DNA gyrase subunit A, partial [Coriobacteriia bacterium]|nr:DNA gyrase subunit A [Coriobacteriia bacterium]
TKTFPDNEYLLFATRAGMVKKTAMDAYKNGRRDGIIAIKMRDDDALISVRRVHEGQKVIMVSTVGKAILWDEDEARPMGRDTQGVKGMNIKESEGEAVLGMEIAPKGSELFVVTERGYGKRTPIDDYPKHHRGGQGVKTIVVTPKKGLLAGMKIVGPGHELMLVSEEGVVIRVKSDDISKLGRSTQGVKVMNVGETDRVSAIARVSSGKKKAKAARAAKAPEGQEALAVEGLELEEPEADEADALLDEEFNEE